jgi:hypothetical protein
MANSNAICTPMEFGLKLSKKIILKVFIKKNQMSIYPYPKMASSFMHIVVDNHPKMCAC